ncbi:MULTISPECIES: hypothetical protein [Bacillus]|uniref:hypothetical protein n=1 Tax=Bacillus TaxID=1386 RepID=UPI00356B66F0
MQLHVYLLKIQTVSVINTATNTVIDMVPVDIAPTGIATGTIFLCSLHTSHS